MKNIITINSCQYANCPSYENSGTGDTQIIVVETINEQTKAKSYEVIFRGDKFSIKDLFDKMGENVDKDEVVRILSSVIY